MIEKNSNMEQSDTTDIDNERSELTDIDVEQSDTTDIDTNSFYIILSGHYPPKIYDILQETDELILSYEYDLANNIGNIIFKIQDDIKYKLQTPQLSRCSGSGPNTAQRAANNQRIVDMWFVLLKQNLQFATNQTYFKSINIIIKDIFVYKNYMVWTDIFKEEYYCIIHPYVKRHYPSIYEEIKKNKRRRGILFYCLYRYLE